MIAMPKRVMDPVRFAELCWPDIALYGKQREILYSVRDNEETYVPAGHELGKDFIAALCALWFFVSRRPARVVTTSVKESQLEDVLWGEIRRFLDTTKVDLGIQYNHMKIRQVRKSDGVFVPLCEMVGQVAAKGESLFGRHLPKDMPRTLAIFDEVSGMDDTAYNGTDTWADRKLIIGNPYPCANFFQKGVAAGQKKALYGSGLERNVIRIRAQDSPNVRHGILQIKAGERRPETLLVHNSQQPWGEYSQAEYERLMAQWMLSGRENPPEVELVPGVIGLYAYLKRRSNIDKMLQCIQLDGEFYQGEELLLFPPDWLNAAEAAYRAVEGQPRRAKAMGIDVAEGGNNTTWAIVDELGLIKLISMKTPDTSVIAGKTAALIREFGIPPEKVFMDAGGGGKQHADYIRNQAGLNIRPIAFGAAATPEKRRGRISFDMRLLADETRQVYKNRRAEMYGITSERFNPVAGGGYALPTIEEPQYRELCRQLSVMPRRYDGEGKLWLPPKNRKNPNSKEETLQEILGCSPDEADALVLAEFAMSPKSDPIVAGVL